MRLADQTCTERTLAYLIRGISSPKSEAIVPVHCHAKAVQRKQCWQLCLLDLKLFWVMGLKDIRHLNARTETQKIFFLFFCRRQVGGPQLCSSTYPGTYYPVQTGLQFRVNPPASASWELELWVCISTSVSNFS